MWVVVVVLVVGRVVCGSGRGTGVVGGVVGVVMFVLVVL